MGFIQACFIRDNTSDIQENLKNIGYHICPCCNFKDAVWLSTLPSNGTVHGIGYTDETRPLTVEKELELFLYQNGNDKIDCGNNINLFLALASLRDDTDDKQIFVNGKGDWGIYHDDETENGLPGIEFGYLPKDNNTNHYHKASVSEITKMFSHE